MSDIVNVKGKKVLVMGLGRFGGGVDVAKFAAKAAAKITVTDLASEEELSNSIKQLEEFPDIEYHLGLHDPADFKQADIIVANPAVPPDNQYLQLARREPERFRVVDAGLSMEQVQEKICACVTEKLREKGHAV